MHGMWLYDEDGQRKYQTPEERDAFLKAAAEAAPREVRTFCGTLVYAGCSITEALELTADRVDIKAGVLVLESLKRRRRGVYRPVPAPPGFLDTLNLVHNLQSVKKRKDRGKNVRVRHQRRGFASAAQHGAKVARPCGATDHGDLCRCCRRGG